MRLVLFDIDGTLIDSGGAGVRALNRAMQNLFAIENAFAGIGMAGRTDTEIIKDGLRKHGLPSEKTGDVVDAYLSYLSEEIRNDRKYVKPGIYEVLSALQAFAHVATGLLTGNLERGARIKLEPFRLNGYFPSGAFGSDDEDRNKLLPIAVERFRRLVGFPIKSEECIVVGDTPRDVECAHNHGAFCIAVATGPYPREALITAGADLVVEDLSDPGAVLRFL